jgi:hypothetical protein
MSSLLRASQLTPPRSVQLQNRTLHNVLLSYAAFWDWQDITGILYETLVSSVDLYMIC